MERKSKSQNKRLEVQFGGYVNHPAYKEMRKQMSPYRRAFMEGHSRQVTWENFIFRHPAEEMNAVRKAFMAGHTRNESWESYARRNHPSAV